MYYRVEVFPKRDLPDPVGTGVLHQIREFLHLPVQNVRARSVFSLSVACTAAQAAEIAAAFTNPVVEQGHLGESRPTLDFDWLVVIGFRPGVTDNVARSARSAVSDILGRPLAETEAIYTSTEYLVVAPELTREQVHEIARNLLGNELIQTSVVLSRRDWEENGVPPNCPAVTDTTPATTAEIDLKVSAADLVRISRERTLALTLEEMETIRDFFSRNAGPRVNIGLSGNPTDVELEVLAQTWSEHCKHKIFNALIEYTDENGRTEMIDSCFRTFIQKSTEEIGRQADWLVSVFDDNAGVIRFDDRLNLVYKVETHNSPTALDPYGGAITGIVGVNRDPLGTGKGATLLLNVWGYCFGSPFTEPERVPAGLFHPRRLRDQVHKGIIDGGNQSGIPYAVGWEYFDDRYLGKPLVYCGTVGTIPTRILDEPGHEKTIRPGDHVVMIGGRIGKDGIHGATFSSEELHQDSPAQAVQIGDPITQKIMADFLREARARGLYRFITDNGAGGLSSSVGEMSTVCGGCEIELADAPLKYAGLKPWEILLSEAQERMSLAVPPADLDTFLDLARTRDVEATVLGHFTDSGVFHVRYDGQTVAFLDVEFLHHGLPQIRARATWTPPRHPEPEIPADLDLKAALLQLLARLNICSGEDKARQYDHEVKGLSVVKPYVGKGNDVLSDATVSLVRPLGRDGVILAAGVAPRYSDIDTYHMTASVIDMAVRRTLAVGGRLGHMAGLDNFCWPDPIAGPGNPDGEYKLAQLVRANQALYDITTAYGTPCISGKDSMKNDCTIGGRRISIPPTILFSTIARMNDVSKAVTLGAKRVGDLVYVLGLTHAELGGSEFLALLGGVGNAVPRVNPDTARRLYAAVADATAAELCHSLHTPALGGLGLALAKVAMAGRLGLNIDMDAVPRTADLSVPELLFSESNSRFVATVPPTHQHAFEALFRGLPCACVGTTTRAPVLSLTHAARPLLSVPVEQLLEAYKDTLRGL